MIYLSTRKTIVTWRINQYLLNSLVIIAAINELLLRLKDNYWRLEIQVFDRAMDREEGLFAASGFEALRSKLRRSFDPLR